MNIPQTVATLREYNKWRRGAEDVECPHPTDIGHAIDSAIKHMQEALEYQSMIHKLTGELNKALEKVVELHGENKALRERIHKLMERGEG